MTVVRSDPYSTLGLLEQVQMDLREEVRRAIEDRDDRLCNSLCGVEVKVSQAIMVLTTPASTLTSNTEN